MDGITALEDSMAGKPDTKAAKRQDSTPPAKAGPVLSMDVGGDREAGPNSLQPLGGSQSKAFNNVLLNQVLETLWLPPGLADDERTRRSRASLAALMEFKPADGIEGMMAVQAVGLHSASVECLRRAMLPEQPAEIVDKLRKQAANMTRTFLDVLAALDRKRGKGGQQVVRVERVMVGPGGQAVVGNIQAGATGGGQDREGVGHGSETRGEPHAPPARLAHDTAFGAVLPPVRGLDPGRDALPFASHAERALPDARRA